MPWPVYSERFVVKSGVSGWHGWTVPVGMRAVVKNATATVGDVTGAFVQVAVAGAVCWLAHFPAINSTMAQDLFLVCYGGETMAVYISHSVVSMALDGYLFEDKTGATGPPGAFVELQPPYPAGGQEL